LHPTHSDEAFRHLFGTRKLLLKRATLFLLLTFWLMRNTKTKIPFQASTNKTSDRISGFSLAAHHELFLKKIEENEKVSEKEEIYFSARSQRHTHGKWAMEKFLFQMYV
jgi:hypothetical protein